MYLEFVILFLLPIAVYVLVLAIINRRDDPLLVTGMWDCAGLLFASSGVLLASGPWILQNIYRRQILADPTSDFDENWIIRMVIWAVYYVVVATIVAFMVLVRMSKSVVYNVDVELFPHVLKRALEQLGYHTRWTATSVTLLRDGSSASQQIHASDVAVVNGPAPSAGSIEWEAVPTMCHVTLHWRQVSPIARLAIEKGLAEHLADARAETNPAAGWLMSVSSILFGVLMLSVSAMILTLFFAWRR